MALDYTGLLADLTQEGRWLLATVSPLSADAWDLPTPAAGWSIKDQILHLQFFDEATILALTDPDSFRPRAAELMTKGPDFPDELAKELRSTPSPQALSEFTATRKKLITLLAELAPAGRMPWYGPEMSVASGATARLMETWAHGQDIYDALGVEHPQGRGLRSIAHLGVQTFGFAHVLRGLSVPDAAVRIDLTAPDSAQTWTWGPADAANTVSGSAQDFALVVTQRRHIDTTSLVTSGDVAARWMKIAQVYAGAPGQGREASSTDC